MAPRKMLTKPVEKALRAAMDEAVTQNRFVLNEGQSVDDVIEYIRAGIKSDTFKPGLTFEEFLAALTGQPAAEATSGDVAQPQGVIDAAKAEVQEPIDDLADWLGLYRKAKAKIEESKEIAEVAKAKITERLGDKTEATIEGKVVATWRWAKTTHFDKTKLAEEHPEIVEQYTKANPTRRFELK